MIRELILANRSFRRFEQNATVETDVLRELIDLARCSASAANRQPLKYMISNTPERNGIVFPTLSWAGDLKNWPGPAEGERPSAYIVILGDTRISSGFGCDHGIAAQSILLGAAERGLGGCMFGAIERNQLRSGLAIPDYLEILLVIALGRPAEKVVLEDVESECGKTLYYRDESDVHHVPKRGLDEVILDI